MSSGERLLWVGQPRRGILLRPADALQIPFSLLWCGFVIFWNFRTLRAGLIFNLIGLVFLIVSLYLVFGRFIVDALIRNRTFYGVTSERVVIVSGLFSRSMRSLNLPTLSDIALTERADGSGTITFGTTVPMSQWFRVGSWAGTSQNSAPAFDTINRAKEVYEIIRRAQNPTT